MIDIKNKQLIVDYLHKASWYHSIRFSEKLKSFGTFDHEEHLPNYGFPDSLEGKAVLDVGCADGFFAFEFEKRKALTVLAVDTNKFDGQVAISPSVSRTEKYEKKYEKYYLQNRRFIKLAQELSLEKVHHILIAKKLLNSNIEYKDMSIYDLEKLNKKFDFVFCGDLIEHLRNPIEAVEQLRKVCNDTCIISLSNPMIELPEVPNWINLITISGLKNRLLTYHGDSGGTFFHFHPETFKQLLLDCGFKKAKIYSKFNLLNKKYGYKSPRIIYHCKT